MSKTYQAALIDAQSVSQLLDQGDLVLLDSTWYLPTHGKNGREEWQKQRIGEAGFFDFDSTVCDPSSPLPHSLPSSELFENEVRKLGVNTNSHVVVYDQIGLFSATRAWFMFLLFGHQRVSVLDGGLPHWIAQGLPINTNTPPEHILSGNFVASAPDSSLLANKQEVLARVHDRQRTICDARPADRFAGTAPEPRPKMRAGHIPGSVNLPFTEVQDGGHLKSDAQLQELFDQHCPPDTPITFSCGSGVTASLLAFAALKCGRTDIRVYDGSWAEWGAEDSGMPVEQGSGDQA